MPEPSKTASKSPQPSTSTSNNRKATNSSTPIGAGPAKGQRRQLRRPKKWTKVYRKAQKIGQKGKQAQKQTATTTKKVSGPLQLPPDRKSPKRRTGGATKQSTSSNYQSQSKDAVKSAHTQDIAHKRSKSSHQTKAGIKEIAKEPIRYPATNAFAYYNSKNTDSILNLHRLLRDGRKTPEQYRNIAQMVSSPSQLSLRSISEFYNVPSTEFSSLDDVFHYRGYRKLNKIDEGAFGVVSKATRMSDNVIVAVKEVDLSRKRSKRIEEMKRELFVLQKIDNPNIVKLIEHFIVGQTLVIIMEFCAGSNLTSYLKETSIGEEEALVFFKQMASAIKVLHRKGIAHRDVKLNNFLLDSGRKFVKVADFGLSVVSYRRAHGILMAKTYCGTEPYMAPEILRRNSMGVRSYNPLYADIWSLGICLFAMLTRTFPFKMNLSQRSLFKIQIARRWRFPRNLRDTLSEDIRDLIWHMLDPEPERRITINGVVAHPWLNQNETVNFSYDEST